MQVQLSHSPRLLRASDAHAEGDAEARAARKKKGVVLQSRAITHPSFRNLPRDKVALTRRRPVVCWWRVAQ